MDENLLDQTEFADNPEPRCPVILMLDTSASMHGAPIQELNSALVAFADALKADRLASLRVEVAIVTFGGQVKVFGLAESGKNITYEAQNAFTTVDHFIPPTLDAHGNTPMGEAVQRSLALLRERKAIYRQSGMDYFRPWLFVITDGKPTDANWEAAAAQVREEEARKGLSFYGVGVENADLEVLQKFSATRTPLKLKGMAFGELFQWLSKSLAVVAHSRPGEQAPLPAVGWAVSDTSHS
jgi:uncharacterized protein YegL